MDKEKQPKKLVLFNILDILRRYTDENHRLSQKEIEDKLAGEPYNMTVDRKTIKTSLMNLEEFGYNLEYSESLRPIKNKKTGEIEDSFILSDFYLHRDFEDSELRLLIDGLLFSKHLPYNQCMELINKIKGQSNEYFQTRVKHIATMSQDRTDSQELFYTIDIIDEAITVGKKVSFKYMEYTTGLQRTAKKTKDGVERVYVVSPYQMAAKEDKYYLICNYDCYDDISNYRVDRIHDIQILDEPVKPFEKLKGANGRRLDLNKYMNEHIYMYSSDTTRVKLRIVNPMISDVVDIFGKNIKFTDKDDKCVTVAVQANENSVVQFAKRYAPDVVVISPDSVREKVKEELRKGYEAYGE